MTERNNSLISRVDERTESILRELQSINEEQKTTNEHLSKLNGKVSRNESRTIVNRYCFWGLVSVDGIIITILLHLMGVY
uniref:Uncharacterized protein n=1 Tax=viral metagenome TaxID=1070528 RepID=A0A6M3J540_9ZZZZ